MNLVQHILLTLVRLYRMVISPALGAFFGPAGGCRFTPTCSVYAADAVRNHGAVRGSWLATKRLCRCHPWGGHGHDPVPGKIIPINETKGLGENFGSECARPRAQQRELTEGDRTTRGPKSCRIAVPGDGHTPLKSVSVVSRIFQTSNKTQPLAASSSTVI